MNTLEMKKARAEEIKNAQGVIKKAEDEKRELTADESTAVEGMMARADELSRQITVKESVEAAAAGLEAVPARQTEPVKQPDNGPDSDASYYRTGKLKAFAGKDAAQAAYRSGMWFRATFLGDPKAIRYIRDNGLQAAMGGDVNTKGGFLVPDEMSQAIIDNREQYGVFRRNCRVVPMSSDTMVIPVRSSGLTAYAVGDNDEITASDKSWSNVELVARKWGALAKYSSELSEDAIISIADDLASEMAYAFASKEDDAGFNGDGTSTYHGIYGVRPKIIDGNHTAGAIDAASGNDTFAEVTATDLAKVMGAVPQYAIANAKWYCSQTAYANLFQRLMAAGGGNTLGDLAGPAQYNYLGYPIVISQSMPTSTGDLSDVAMVLFGDLGRAAIMGDRRGFRFMVSDQRYMELDQLGIMGTERYDIKVHSLGDTSTAGPIVALVGE